MNKKHNSFLETESVGKLMRKFSIPCILSLLIAALYNIVDQIFIANASYLGSYGNAANNVVFPLTIVALSVAVMIGDGCCTFVSICLGQDHKEEAKQSVGNAVVLAVISSLLIMILYLVFRDGIITMFGGRVNEETFKFAQEYFLWITLGLPFYMFGQAVNPIIRSDGSPGFAMATTVLSAVVNCIFDPIFIFGCKWGMIGAAIATDMGQILTAVLALWYLGNMKAVKLDSSSFRLNMRTIRRFVPLGMTSFLSQISIVASMAVVNNMILKYSARDQIFAKAEFSQIPMAVVGIVMKFFQIIISISVGLAAGCIPIVGFNLGAGRRDRVQELMTTLLTLEFIIGLIGVLIAETLPRQLIGIFGAGNESVYYTQFAIKAFRIYLCLLPLSLVNKGSFIFLQSMGKAKESSLLSMLREIVFGVGLAILIPAFMRLDGVLWQMPIADALTFFVTIFVIHSVTKENKGYLTVQNCSIGQR